MVPSFQRSEEELARAGDSLRGTLGDPRRRVLLRGGTVLTMDTAIGDLARGDVLIEGATIAAVEPDLSQVATDGGAVVVAAEGMVVMPGMHDVHRHCWQTQFRRLMTGCELSTYQDVLLRKLGPLYRPDDMYTGTLAAGLGALDSGITTLQDFSHNSRSQEHSDRAIDALRDAGIRTVHASGPPLSGKWDEQWPEDLRRLRQRIGSHEPLLSLRSALLGSDEVGGSFYALRPESIAHARSLGLGMTVDAAFGPAAAANIEFLGRAGLLGPDVTLLHCNAFTDEAWRVIADSGAQVGLCPTSDTQLGIFDATPPADKAKQFGVRPGLCVDVECALGTDMFAQMQAIYTTQRMLTYRRRYYNEADVGVPIDLRTVLEMATVNGSQANGLSAEVGTLASGMQADVVLIDVESAETLPLNSALGAAVIGASSKDVDTVFVAGKLRKWRGQLIDFDLATLRVAVHVSRDDLLARAGFTLDVCSGNLTRSEEI
jgi:cytosine/adenosine deaminase-related metal-dependent hydrolase